jgi:uncharacterized protein (TIGR02246 family)
MSPDERAIRDLVDTWMKASRTGDTATVLSLMSDDVIFMVPGREPFGKDAFAASSQSMKGFRLEGSADVRELKVLGDWAYLRNFIEITVTPFCGASPAICSTTGSLLLHRSPPAALSTAAVMLKFPPLQVKLYVFFSAAEAMLASSATERKTARFITSCATCPRLSSTRH